VASPFQDRTGIGPVPYAPMTMGEAAVPWPLTVSRWFRYVEPRASRISSPALYAPLVAINEHQGVVVVVPVPASEHPGEALLT
jgi:hypothetical protein